MSWFDKREDLKGVDQSQRHLQQTRNPTTEPRCSKWGYFDIHRCNNHNGAPKLHYHLNCHVATTAEQRATASVFLKKEIAEYK